MGDKIYFISDVHLGMPNPVRPVREQEGVLIDFLRAIQTDAAVLYIVGDLFDFWFEYRSVVPAHGARVLFELYHLIQQGVRVVCLPGNHDLWLGRYLSEQVGMELPGDPLVVGHQNKKLYLTHGDAFRRDWAFRFSRGILKHPWCIGLFRLLHPDFGMWLAQCTSRVSERHVRNSDLDQKILHREAVAKIAEGCQYVICGHYHRVCMEDIGDGKLIVLGDWVYDDTYAVMENGEIELKRWCIGKGLSP
jgi:UDP-2,3-diacylglucosamine hydrolase